MAVLKNYETCSTLLIKGENFDDRHVFLGVLAWVEFIFVVIAVSLMG